MIKNNVVKNSPNQVLVHTTRVTSGGAHNARKRALVRAKQVKNINIKTQF